MIELRHLRYFLSVAQHRNFSRAAEELHMAQPPLSRQIKDIEIELGVALFDRTSRPLQLTEAGRIFYSHALNVTQQMTVLHHSMKEVIKSVRQVFTVGFVPSVLYAGLPDVIRAFRVSQADIDLRLIEMTSLEQINALSDGRINAGLGRIRYENILVHREVIINEPLLVALPHNLASKLPLVVPLDQLAENNLIIYPNAPRPSYADQVLSLFTDYGIEPKSIQEVHELQTAIGLVSADMGICIVPQSVQLLERRDVIYRSISEKAFSPIILSHRRSDHSPLLSDFKVLVLEQFLSRADGI